MKPELFSILDDHLTTFAILSSKTQHNNSDVLSLLVTIAT